MTVLPAFKVLLCTFVVLLAFWTYGKTYFYRDPGSVLFYDEERAFERKYSVFREKEVLAFREELLKTKNFTEIPKAGENPSICALFVTSDKRANEENSVHPVELSILSLLAGLTRKEREDIHVQLYYATLSPSKHPLWKSWVTDTSHHIIDGSDSAITIGPLRIHLDRLKKWDAEKRFASKASLDYSFALQSCLEKTHPKTPYIAVFEGDTLLAHGWHARTRKGLQDIERTYAGRSEEWLDLRLFKPESSTGWASKHVFGNNVPLIIAGISSSILTAAIVFRSRNRHGKGALLASTWLSNSVLFVVCAITVPVLVVTFYQAGKASMLPSWRGVSKQNWGCCGQGFVMPRNRVRALINEFQARAEELAPDIIMRQYGRNNGLAGWIMNPSMVQHMGKSSVISPERTQQQFPWSIAFEDLNPIKLKREHAEIVRRLYPADEEALLL